jgi:hypothetical protein
VLPELRHANASVGHAVSRDLLYTGTSCGDGGLVQRIGLATSSDLVTWTKHPANPVLEADRRWYELIDDTTWHDQAWRDPWLFRNRDDGTFHALVTARANDGPQNGPTARTRGSSSRSGTSRQTARSLVS